MSRLSAIARRHGSRNAGGLAVILAGLTRCLTLSSCLAWASCLARTAGLTLAACLARAASLAPTCAKSKPFAGGIRKVCRQVPLDRLPADWLGGALCRPNQGRRLSRRPTTHRRCSLEVRNTMLHGTV